MAPAPRDSHARLAFLSMAATSARSLKQHVPYARCVLILGFQTPQGEPYASSTTPHRGRTGDRASAASPSAASAPAASSSAMQASERTWPNRTEATRPASWTDALSEDEAKQLESFDRIVRWADPSLFSLSSTLYPAHRGWLLKPSMLAASPYEHSVFFDADTTIESADAAYLFALLATRSVEFFAAPEVSSSNSRRALGKPIYNSGVLGWTRSAAAVDQLFRRWVGSSWAVVCRLQLAQGYKGQWTVHRPPGVPSRLDEESAWRLATNDQFGLAQLVTPEGAATALTNLSRLTLPSRFNRRAGPSPEGAAGEAEIVVVRHDGQMKERIYRQVMRQVRRATAGRWEARTAARAITRAASTTREDGRVEHGRASDMGAALSTWQVRAAERAGVARGLEQAKAACA